MFQISIVLHFGKFVATEHTVSDVHIWWKCWYLPPPITRFITLSTALVRINGIFSFSCFSLLFEKRLDKDLPKTSFSLCRVRSFVGSIFKTVFILLKKFFCNLSFVSRFDWRASGVGKYCDDLKVRRPRPHLVDNQPLNVGRYDLNISFCSISVYYCLQYATIICNV